jgi:hypothetical protein
MRERSDDVWIPIQDYGYWIYKFGYFKKWLTGTSPELSAARTLPAGRQVMRRLAACGSIAPLF